ncbi:MAG: DUF2971 domain-containing protein [Flavobacterium sp.]|nr:MAG: DUF2971 domain-containing protein [Flavobacterium sp.]
MMISVEEIASITTSDDPYLRYPEICKAKGVILNITPEKQLAIIHKRFSDITAERSANLRVSCFTENHDSLLMWAHYADQHKGFCLEYDFLDEDQIRAFLQPVVYSEKIRQIGLLEELTMLTNIGSSLVKSMEWAYELEWRITSFKLGEEFLNYVTAPNPSAVYLGTRFDQNDEHLQKEFLDVFHQKEIPVYQMVKHHTEFKVIRSENQ